jgi:trimeric autotransporter adhesin
MKKPLLFLFSAVLFSLYGFSQTPIDAGPLNEVFMKTDLVPAAGNLADPWEITYGADDSLWVTEAKGYKVKKVNINNGGQRTVLDLSWRSTFLPLADTNFNVKFTIATHNPQGGMMGMVIHPDFFKPVNPKRYIFVAYIHDFVTSLPSNGGDFYTNRIVRFTYNTSTNKFDSPMIICDTIPGSSDHNSGRLIIAPVGDSMYLFYGAGDMGAGQFQNSNRTEKAQNVLSYEGKILRFRINADNDAGALDRWIPSGPGTDGNPFNNYAGATQSAVYAMGIRNNQGFAYMNGNLYGSQHGPFSDDEINIFRAGKNYGHPLVIGDSTDGNYNNAKAGPAASSLPLIVNEGVNARAFRDASNNPNYMNPIFTFYPAPAGSTAIPWSIQYIYTDQDPDGPGGNPDALNANGNWASEATSGIDAYSNSLIPGWKNSLLIGCLKGGRIIRLPLNAAGTGTTPNGNVNDTTTLFRSVNRFRDIALSPDGLTLYTVIDSSSTTSGPTTSNPIVSQCSGCLQKYTFIGYNPGTTAFPTTGFTSMIPNSIKIAPALANQCEDANYVVINAAHNNTNVWVPITDTNSNIIAEIYSNGKNLDTVRTSVYRNSGAIRKDGGNRYYADRNLTITPQTQPGANVAIRLYITAAEFTALNSAPSSGIGGLISNVGIFKNSNNTCVPVLSGGPATAITTVSQASFGSGYVLQSNALPSFSTFYFANKTLTTLPVQLLSFTGNLNNNATLLNWATTNEVNAQSFVVERSENGNDYNGIGTVAANGTTTTTINYSYTDNDVATLSSSTIYYRLKIVDRDGNFAYSNVITVSLSDITGRVTVFPNPVAAEAKVTMAAAFDGKAQWKVIDNAGRVVMQSTSQLRKGRNNIVINLDKLSSGTYYLRVSGAGIDQNVRMQKL